MSRAVPDDATLVLSARYAGEVVPASTSGDRVFRRSWPPGWKRRRRHRPGRLADHDRTECPAADSGACPGLSIVMYAIGNAVGIAAVGVLFASLTGPRSRLPSLGARVAGFWVCFS